MATKRFSLQSFLQSAKSAVKINSGSKRKPLRFVVGNESADLDSICCALVYAYLRTSTPPYDLHIPLFNLQATDFSIRPELKPVFSTAEINTDDLVTLSDLPEKIPAEDTFFLVDHNALTGQLSSVPSSQIVGCIDHHDDENYVPKSADVRVIEKCGSCMSLIIAQTEETWKGLKASDDIVGLAKVALAPVLTDNNNMKDEHKVREVDEKSVAFLEGLLEGYDYDRTAYFEEISKAKQDVESLDLNGLFRKDYKSWEENGLRLGMSTIVKDICFLQQKTASPDEFVESMKVYADERQLDIFAIMTTSTSDGNFKRELLVSAYDEKAIEAIKRFEANDSKTLGLETWQDGQLNTSYGVYRRCWDQTSLQYSRKKVGPLLREAMRTI